VGHGRTFGVSWIYQNEPFDSSQIGQYSGFTYLITNKIDDRRYIGKKLFWFSKTRTVKGKKKRTKVESDWKDYWSSSVELQEDVKRLGEENFTREILTLCKTKGMASYLEAKAQFLNEVLEHPEQWYNAQIRVRVHRSHVKT